MPLLTRLVWFVSASPTRRLSGWLLGLMAAAWLLFRFVGLGHTPPGFWMDEAWDAAHALCLAETGRDANGRPWPLFSNALGGGSLPITWSVFNVAWTRIFGTSIGAFRAAATFWILVTCAALFGIARVVRLAVPARSAVEDPDQPALRAFPLLVGFAALLSPWSFQFSRISWEGPMAPAFLTLSLWTLARLWAERNRRWLLWTMLSGATAALSMISYPPLRVAVPLILALAIVAFAAATKPGESRPRFLLRLLPGVLVFALLIAPVVALTIRGDILSRTMSVAIFSPEWLDKNRGEMGRLSFFLITFLDNLFAHLRPTYLFFIGDPNFRHSAHLVGQLSPIDVLALCLGLLAIARLLWLAMRQTTGTGALRWPRVGRTGQVLAMVAGFAVVAGFFATLPAALTWESLPHALRSIGAWPFVALFTGALLALGWSRVPALPPLLVLVGLIYSAAYLPGYFRVYRQVDVNVFHRDLTEAVAAGQAARPPRTALQSIAPLVPRYGDEVLRYFLIHHDGMTCQGSADALRDLRQKR